MTSFSSARSSSPSSPSSSAPASLTEFTFEIWETLVKCITVEAENVEEAYHEVRRLYKRGDIILDAEDFLDYEITFLE